MEVYPASPVPSYGIIIEAIYRTAIGKADSGKEYRKSKSPYATYNVTLPYNTLTVANVMILWNFYLNRRGAFDAFWFYDVSIAAHINLYVGTGDGSTAIFDLPGKSTSAQSIYKDGILQVSGYSILTGGGDGNSDRVDFTTPLTAGIEVSCNFTGYLRIPCRYKEDKMSRERFTALLDKTGIELLGLSFDQL
jgi:hypothetical protein